MSAQKTNVKRNEVPVESCDSIQEALFIIQHALVANKDLTSEDGWKYRSAESIINSLKPLLQQLKVISYFSDRPVLVGTWNYIETTFTMCHVPTGGVMTATASARENLAEAGKCAAQLTGSASSYSHKTALCNLLLVDDNRVGPTEDPDRCNHYPIDSRRAAGVPAKPRLWPGSPEWKRNVDGIASSKDSKETIINVITSGYEITQEDLQRLLAEACVGAD